MASDGEAEPLAKRSKWEVSGSGSAECARVRGEVREVLGVGESDGVQDDTLEGLDRLRKERLHRLLLDVDADRANTLHPNDTRKVVRSVHY